MTPIKKVINEMIGIAPTPAAIAWWMARCSMRSRFKGDRNSSPQRFAEDFRQASDVRHTTLGCSAHLCHPLPHDVPKASCSV